MCSASRSNLARRRDRDAEVKPRCAPTARHDAQAACRTAYDVTAIIPCLQLVVPASSVVPRSVYGQQGPLTCLLLSYVHNTGHASKSARARVPLQKRFNHKRQTPCPPPSSQLVPVTMLKGRRILTQPNFVLESGPRTKGKVCRLMFGVGERREACRALSTRSGSFMLGTQNQSSWGGECKPTDRAQGIH